MLKESLSAGEKYTMNLFLYFLVFCDFFTPEISEFESVLLVVGKIKMVREGNLR
jgi:hypothetical protein